MKPRRQFSQVFILNLRVHSHVVNNFFWQRFKTIRRGDILNPWLQARQ